MSDKKQIKLNIDGTDVIVDKGTTILEAAKKSKCRYSNIMFFEGYKRSWRL